MDLITETWNELNKVLECKNTKILVRTDPVQDKIGSIYLPARKASFYGRIQGQYQWCRATVLAKGPESTVEPGEHVLFTRLAFANLYKMKDNSYVGLVDEEHVDLVLGADVQIEPVLQGK